MSEKDFAVGMTGAPPVGQVSKKPCYLITLDNTLGKTKLAVHFERFIAIDKPDLQTNFILVKGVFSELSEEEIIRKFTEVLLNTPKEMIADMMFPSHRVHSIKSLVFNANKPSTLIK